MTSITLSPIILLLLIKLQGNTAVAMGNCCNLICRNTKQCPTTRTIVPNHCVPEDTLPRNHPNVHFANNRVKTTKYTLLTFIPLNLWDQFHRFANVYFVFIVILNFMPEISAFSKEIAPIPVLFVLAVTAIKDAFEDYRRYKADKKVNHSTAKVYDRYVLHVLLF